MFYALKKSTRPNLRLLTKCVEAVYNSGKKKLDSCDYKHMMKEMVNKNFSKLRAIQDIIYGLPLILVNCNLLGRNHNCRALSITVFS